MDGEAEGFVAISDGVQLEEGVVVEDWESEGVRVSAFDAVPEGDCVSDELVVSSTVVEIVRE